MPSWTIRGVLRRMLATVRRRPLDAILAVGILPAIWMIPAMMAQTALVVYGPSGPDRSLRAFIVLWLATAWGCVWFGGQLSAAIAVARNCPVRWGSFIAGLPKAPAFLLAGALPVLPSEVITYWPRAQDTVRWEAGEMAVLAVALFFVARTALWTPLLLQGRRTFWESLVASWAASRGHSLRLIGLGATLFLLSTPILVVEAALLKSPSPFHVTCGVMEVLCTFAAAELFVLSDIGSGHADLTFPDAVFPASAPLAAPSRFPRE